VLYRLIQRIIDKGILSLETKSVKFVDSPKRSQRDAPRRTSQHDHGAEGFTSGSKSRKDGHEANATWVTDRRP